MKDIAATRFEMNGRGYEAPARAVAVICLDGSADDYLNAALARGLGADLVIVGNAFELAGQLQLDAVL
ncbi:MAG TPA: hypothetical protein DCY13_01340, partial [Verrucomicrobiales bacterium]|nr:hypothetical protein [Verrucomicrobiales bacterium]